MSDHPAGPPASDDGYRPDPAAEMRMVIDAFFAALAAARPGDADLAARLRRRHERLLADQRDRVVDAASRHNLALTLAVLAGYRELTPLYDDDERLLGLLRDAFVEPLRAPVRTGTAAALDAAPDPFAAMVEISRYRERHAFGAGFVFTHPHDDDDHYVAQVERCYYHDVLSANDAARLTPVFCAFDANWIDAIDPDRHGFAFDRPTTIGTGGVTCPFRFRRTAG
ncbi:MAG TPA: L-2-amino-thiazoline-4-carboxylic acid hydrolase [Streptosporangiaceae bacterium]|nr:L-2-amino-thiazoline-4-carboxylic acid hydrolase [Streptosporangiaceae bacterium]